MKPIIFNTEMVRAILDGRKTQTRRPVKLKDLTRNPDNDNWYKDRIWSWRVKSGTWTDRTHNGLMEYAPYQVGDVLYVRETLLWESYASRGLTDMRYLADDQEVGGEWDESYEPPFYGRMSHWESGDNIPGGGFSYTTGRVNSIHMPKWAARIFLKVTAVRLERVQDISEEDAMAEGVNRIDHGRGDYYYSAIHDEPHPKNWVDPTYAFMELWKSIYGNWADNPWVWVIEFEKIEKPEGA